MKLFFAQLFLLISSVSMEQSQICLKTRTGRLVEAAQSGPLFAPANLLIMTPRPSIEIPAREKSIAEAQRVSGKATTTRSFVKNLY